MLVCDRCERSNDVKATRIYGGTRPESNDRTTYEGTVWPKVVEVEADLCPSCREELARTIKRFVETLPKIQERR